MTAILRSAALRDIEARHAEAQPPLMERAGRAAAQLALRLQAALEGPPLIFAGPGNNGGDALVVARLLREAGLAPVVASSADAERLPADARQAMQAWRRAGGEICSEVPEGRYGLVVDGLFGIGLTRPLEGHYAQWVERINGYGGPVLALDCPSGLDSETGHVLGRAVRASHTLSFIALKPGLLTLDGPDCCGELTLNDLGLDLGNGVAAATSGRLVERALFADHLRPRRRNSHKGSHGSVGILGGAPGMAGAALLAGRAALKLGAGRVHVGMLEALAVDHAQPELMLRAANEVLGLATVLAVGPGLGQTAQAAELLRQTIATALPLVLDADGLNLLASHPVLGGRLARRDAPTLLTPHPAEAARLLDGSVDAVQADRLAAALELARRFNAVVVLKGCGSVIASPDSHWFINATGNPGLASAGSGDVLTGIVAALLAQGWPAVEAALGGVHLHGAAADMLVAAQAGPIGLTAGELADAARRLLNAWCVQNQPNSGLRG
ncbi:bifunctional ADP-dependent NAD(P)H-hydrate dehydratase/NAD(P)H-hydrate epimerase [Denitratisoma sp. DHT3]|uniref:NAD(P)H-hydrate dehydratase n=1 Tax=Denitratisoma sp. DHT3 TaxID=1981880 RepID=UPI00119855B0|nr:NAD(P)H-hydrate dehydratase [Denitratisoma sp. DHT3]QDX80524.1 bifunctional ADP-dependent NAD(P)H-hydrate dehydratase/NAD(P)H-hydrate epimerase [Denitratisoma sp. DHT3]